jgi:hypothetical protein
MPPPRLSDCMSWKAACHFFFSLSAGQFDFRFNVLHRQKAKVWARCLGSSRVFDVSNTRSEALAIKLLLCHASS